MTDRDSATSRSGCHVFIACSLDGYIATSEGGIDWLDPYAGSDEDHGYQAFIESVDALVIGRGTYETALGFSPWPYDKPVVVMSRSLSAQDVPAGLADTVEISAAGPREVVSRLARRGLNELYVDGGQLIQSFLQAGLIDDLIITRVPILLGAGRPLFAGDASQVLLEHLGTTSFPSGLVQSHYRA